MPKSLSHRTWRSSRPRPGNGSQGSILVITAVVTLTLAFVSASFYHTVASGVELMRSETAGLQADLLADSALAYAQRQLAINSHWEGTEGEVVDMLDGLAFSIERLDDKSDPNAIHVRFAGMDGEAIVRREAMLGASNPFTDPSSPYYNNTLTVFGGDIFVNNATIHGNVLLLDKKDKILDYDPVKDKWEPAWKMDQPKTRFMANLKGGVVKSHGGAGGRGATKEIIEEAVAVPHWDLEQYLDPSANTVVIYDNEVRGVSTDQTVVVVAPPGDTIRIQNSDLRGGLVVYAEPDYDYRGPARNNIIFQSTQFGDGSNGMHPHLGIIAPGGHLEHAHSFSTAGLFYLHSVRHMNAYTINPGAMMVVNDAGHLNNLNMAPPPENMFNIPFPGLELDEEFSANVVVHGVWESFPEYQDNWSGKSTRL